MANKKKATQEKVIIKVYDPFKPHQIFSLNRISIITGINKDKLYNNAKGSSKNMNLTDKEIQQIKDVIVEAQKDFFDLLGE